MCSKPLSTWLQKSSNVKTEEWILIYKNIRQDLQDQLDKRAFGPKISPRKKSLPR